MVSMYLMCFLTIYQFTTGLKPQDMCQFTVLCFYNGWLLSLLVAFLFSL